MIASADAINEAIDSLERFHDRVFPAAAVDEITQLIGKFIDEDIVAGVAQMRQKRSPSHGLPAPTEFLSNIHNAKIVRERKILEEHQVEERRMLFADDGLRSTSSFAKECFELFDRARGSGADKMAEALQELDRKYPHRGCAEAVQLHRSRMREIQGGSAHD